MGFFSELKEDLSQAVNEMVADEMVTDESADKKEDLVEEQEVTESDMLDISQIDEMEEAVDEVTEENNLDVAIESDDDTFNVELEKMLENVDDIVVPKEYEVELNEFEGLAELLDQNDLNNQIAEDDNQLEEDEEPMLDYHNMKLVEDNVNFAQEKTFGGRKMESRNISDDVAVITKGMTIKGDIEAEGNVDILGTVTGNINILGKLNVTGTISGNAQADEVYADNAKITGDIQSEGSTKVGQDTVIIGNVFAKSAVIAGAIKGDIDVQGPVILDSSAIVMGNIKSKAVQINNGAVIEGMCSQCYAEVSPTSFFDEINNRMNR